MCEGPRVIAAALDHGVTLSECYLGVDATAEMEAVAQRVAATGVPLRVLDTYAGARVGDTVNPQPVFALAAMHRLGVEGLDGADLALVAPKLGDPGNAGTLVRSAAAAGAQVIVLGRGSVDAYNPKVVRASAGACFAVRIVEGMTAVEILEALGARGVACLGAAATGGAPPESFDLRAPTAFVLGHETQGLDPALALDAAVTIPMAGGGVAQRRDGRHGAALRGGAPAPGRTMTAATDLVARAEAIVADGVDAFAARSIARRSRRGRAPLPREVVAAERDPGGDQERRRIRARARRQGRCRAPAPISKRRTTARRAVLDARSRFRVGHP